MEKREEYAKVCFELRERQDELLKFDVSTFVLNPEINTLIDEIAELEVIKANLEKELGGAK
jgi:hypothetical protein|nr:MAG TPA: centrosomin [Caudoviricetes sp.]